MYNDMYVFNIYILNRKTHLFKCLSTKVVLPTKVGFNINGTGEIL